MVIWNDWSIFIPFFSYIKHIFPSQISESTNSQRWTDEFLKWDPRDYNKIQELDENIDELWSPDLSLFNA